MQYSRITPADNAAIPNMQLPLQQLQVANASFSFNLLPHRQIGDKEIDLVE